MPHAYILDHRQGMRLKLLNLVLINLYKWSCIVHLELKSKPKINRALHMTWTSQWVWYMNPHLVDQNILLFPATNDQ